MKSKQKIPIVFKLSILFVLITLLFACGGKLLSYRGSWIEEQDRISLQAGGPYKGSWQTRDLSIEYEYQQEAQNLLISGVVNLADYLKIMGTLDHLTLEIQLLETNGIVQDTKGIRTFGNRRSIESFGKMSFSNRLDLSEDTVALAFSYDGKITQVGGGFVGPLPGLVVHGADPTEDGEDHAVREGEGVVGGDQGVTDQRVGLGEDVGIGSLQTDRGRSIPPFWARHHRPNGSDPVFKIV